MIHINTILCRILIGFFFLKDFFFLLEDPEEVFFTETGRPLWDGLGDFLPVLPFFPLRAKADIVIHSGKNNVAFDLFVSKIGQLLKELKK